MTWTQVVTPFAPAGRSGHGMVHDPIAGQTLLFGGRDSNGHLADLWRFDGAAWSELSGRTMPVWMTSPAMAYFPARRQTVLYGGATTGGFPREDTWEFDGRSWVRSQMAPPPRRSAATMVADTARDRLLLFGGFDGNTSTTLGDMWAYDAAGQWSQLSPATSPPARSAAGFVYDAARDRAVLFGGWGQVVSAMDDTWEFDGSTWVPVATAVSPPGRRQMSFAYDAARGRAVLFGGFDGGQTFGDTWEYDGTDWVELTPATSPEGRSSSILAYDPLRRRAMLFGGWGETTPFLGDLWEFDGSDWVELTPQMPPTARRHHAFAYDGQLRAIVLFGGTAGPGALFQDTWILRWESQVPDEICDNATDDDADGETDCADPDCAGAPGC